MHAAKVTSF